MVQTINLGSSQAPYWEFTKTLAAHEVWKLDYVTDSFHLLKVSAQNALKVSFGGSMIETPFSAGMGYRLTEPVQFIQLHNESASAITVHFVVGIGNIRDDRLTVTGNVNTVINGNSGFSTVTAGSATGAHNYTVPANSEVSLMVTQDSITVNYSAGNIAITNMVLPEGSTWQTTLATSGTLAITGTGSYNYQIGSY